MVTRIDGPSRAGDLAEASQQSARAKNGLAKITSAESPSLDANEATIIVVDRRVLFRDCLVRCLRSIHPRGRILAFASLAEWLAAANDLPSPALLVVCVSGKKAIEPDLRRELTRLSAQRRNPPAVIISDTEDFDSVSMLLWRAVHEFLSERSRVRVGFRAGKLATGTSGSKDVGDDAGELDPSLSARQLAILRALRQGKGDRQIAGELRVRRSTVRVHLRKILKRLNADSVAEIAGSTDRLLEHEGQIVAMRSSDGPSPERKEEDPTMRNNTAKLRVVVIDPHKLRQAGLVRLLEGWADANGLQVTTISRAEDLDVGPDCAIVVLNVGGASLREPDSQVWVKRVRAAVPDVPLVILSDREERSEILAAFGEGATGFIATSLDPSLALEALTFLLRGGSFFPLSALLEEARPAHPGTSGVAPASAGGEAPPVQLGWQTPDPSRGEGVSGADDQTPLLTPRQREVLARLREGKSNKVIARELSMTEATVKVHVRQIMRKFGAANRTQAVLCAARIAAAVET